MSGAHRPLPRTDRPATAGARPSEAGFTLTELVIAVAVTVLVGLLIMTVFTAQAESYRRQEDVAKAQQNLRLAMEIVTRDIAMAGFGFSSSGQSWGALTSQGSDENQPLSAIWLRQNWSGDGSDAVEIAYMDSNESTWAIAFPSVPPSCSTDSIQFSENDFNAAGAYSSGMQILCYDPGFRAGPRSFVWAVSGVGDPATGVVPVTSASQDDFTDNCDDDNGAGLSREMSCAPLVRVAYYIDNDDGDGIGPGSPSQPVLMLSFSNQYPTSDDIPIALGIEDLQFDLCLAGGNCRVNGYQNNYAVYDTRTYSYTSLQSVTVRMMARSLRTDIVSDQVSRRVDISDDPHDTESGTPDGYHRRIASTEVMLRNAIAAWQMTQTF